MSAITKTGRPVEGPEDGMLSGKPGLTTKGKRDVTTQFNAASRLFIPTMGREDASFRPRRVGSHRPPAQRPSDGIKGAQLPASGLQSIIARSNTTYVEGREGRCSIEGGKPFWPMDKRVAAAVEPEMSFIQALAEEAVSRERSDIARRLCTQVRGLDDAARSLINNDGISTAKVTAFVQGELREAGSVASGYLTRDIETRKFLSEDGKVSTPVTAPGGSRVAMNQSSHNATVSGRGSVVDKSHSGLSRRTVEYSFPKSNELKRCLGERSSLKDIPYFSEKGITQAVATLAAKRFQNSQKNDLGIGVGASLVVVDVARGVDGFSGEKLPKVNIPGRIAPQLQMSLGQALKDCGRKQSAE
ncbi:MAG: hypothetical protein K9M07_02085 [Simkaniaceae bacterium]|nr:hypothetical protein [Simkaniaceae bacterium]MCF7852011.1 hypothetical protein [Simkaniaceae bacterium]